MEKEIKLSLETAKQIYKEAVDKTQIFTMAWLFTHYKKEELEKSSDIDAMFASWTEFMNDHAIEQCKLPWSKEECENDSEKAGDVAFHMVQQVVKRANKDTPKTDKYWIPYFNNDGSGFFDGGGGWYGGGVAVSSRLRYNSKERCEEYVKKYEPIYKVYQY